MAAKKPHARRKPESTSCPELLSALKLFKTLGFKGGLTILESGIYAEHAGKLAYAQIKDLGVECRVDKLDTFYDAVLGAEGEVKFVFANDMLTVATDSSETSMRAFVANPYPQFQMLAPIADNGQFNRILKLAAFADEAGIERVAVTEGRALATDRHVYVETSFMQTPPITFESEFLSKIARVPGNLIGFGSMEGRHEAFLLFTNNEINMAFSGPLLTGSKITLPDLQPIVSKAVVEGHFRAAEKLAKSAAVNAIYFRDDKASVKTDGGTTSQSVPVGVPDGSIWELEIFRAIQPFVSMSEFTQYEEGWKLGFEADGFRGEFLSCVEENADA